MSWTARFDMEESRQKTDIPDLYSIEDRMDLRSCNINGTIFQFENRNRSKNEVISKISSFFYVAYSI